LAQTIASFEGARRHEHFGLPFLPAVSSRAYVAVCRAELGLFAEGRVLGEEGLRIAEAGAHPVSLIFACGGIGLLALRQGDLPRALPRLERAVGLCQDADLPVYFPWVAAALGAAYTLTGRVAEAVPLLTQAMEQTTAMETVGFQTLCRLSLGEAHLLEGRLEEALDLMDRTLALTRQRQERGNEAYALCLLGEIAARCAPPESAAAEAHYRQALALAEELGMRPLVTHCHHGLGKLYATIGCHAEARAELSTAIELYQSMEMTFWLPQAEAALAEGWSMRKTVKWKNYYLDEKAIKQAQKVLGTKTETETIQKALELIADEARLAQALKNLLDKGKDHIHGESTYAVWHW
jgi:tetratricopeptide (TPR) repeat protein